MFSLGFNKTAGMGNLLLNTARKTIGTQAGRKLIMQGAASGALGGAVTGALSRDETGQRAGLGGALKGAAMGGATGALGGLGQGMYQRKNLAGQFKGNVGESRSAYKGLRGLGKNTGMKPSQATRQFVESKLGQ